MGMLEKKGEKENNGKKSLTNLNVYGIIST